MDLGINGRRALVTGASLGIGRAVAEELAREGCDVAMVARTEGPLRHAADDIARATGRRVVAVQADASLPDTIPEAVRRATDGLSGSIDILVNNAGSTPEDGNDRVDFAKWQYSVCVKQLVYVRFPQLVLRPMRAQKWGRIVNVIGRSGPQPRPVYLAGGAVNAGLLSFTKALAEDCAKDNVLVTGVNPGPIDTPRWQSLREAAVRTRGVTAEQYDGRAIASVPLGRLGTSEECAAVIVFLCSARASYVTGEIVNIDGGGTRCI